MREEGSPKREMEVDAEALGHLIDLYSSLKSFFVLEMKRYCDCDGRKVVYGLFQLHW